MLFVLLLVAPLSLLALEEAEDIGNPPTERSQQAPASASKSKPTTQKPVQRPKRMLPVVSTEKQRLPRPVVAEKLPPGKPRYSMPPGDKQ